MTKINSYRFEKLGKKFEKMGVKIDDCLIKQKEAVDKEDYKSFYFYSEKLNKLLSKRGKIICKRFKLLNIN